MKTLQTRHQREYISLSSKEKKRRLLLYVESILESKLYKHEFSQLLKHFNLTRAEIIHAFLDYNLDVHTHDNAIYRYEAIRVVLHMHNLIKNSWHIDRQIAVRNLIKLANPSSAIDLGFGVPSLYVKEACTTPSFHLTLCDKEESAITFAEALLEIWGFEWRDKISFLQEDIEDFASCIGDYDLYITLHSIEHIPNPTDCLAQYVHYSKPDAKFLIEIPIGPITPEHYLSWDNIEQARNWMINIGLEIIQQNYTSVNPSVDIFAEVHGYNYGGYLALCKKASVS